MCMIDYMPVEKHHSTDLGCGHTVCHECWQDYIKQRVKEGQTCIYTKCPEPDCEHMVSVEMVDELIEKEVADMYFRF